jgi:hypothetical protein
LNTAINTAIKKMNIAGIAAIFGSIHFKLSKTENAIQPQTIITANCFNQSPKNIGSSFSI